MNALSLSTQSQTQSTSTREVSSPVDIGTAPLPSFLLRQPLLDGEYRIVGYELCFNQRMPTPVQPGAASLEQSQDEMLMSWVLDLHQQKSLSRKFTLLNLHASSLEHPLLGALPREHTLIAPYGLRLRPETLARCQALAERGQTLVMDETALQPGMAPLLRYGRYLRLDVGNNDLTALCDRLTPLQNIRGPRLIARNVGNEEAYAACRKLSFDLYQGFFFTQMRPGVGKAIEANRINIMHLLNLVKSEAPHSTIETRFKQDAGLSLRLLRYINSPGVGLRYPVSSIGHVLLLLGHEQLYRWLTLLLFTHEQGNGRSQALLRNALVRARIMESLGETRLSKELKGGLFITGILSMLDALLNLPMGQAIADLKVIQPITDALLHQRGVYAPYLHLARACESGEQTALAAAAAQLGIAAVDLNKAHLDALVWLEGLDL